MLTYEEELEVEKERIERIVENYHVIYQVVDAPEWIIDKVDLDCAIHSLEYKERMVITLVLIQGYTITEAAQMIGIGKSTVGRLKIQAIEKIAEKCLLI